MIFDNTASILKKSEKIDFTPSNSFKDQMKIIEAFPVKPTDINILQINFGKKCNQKCIHCHVEAGPERTEMISKDILKSCIDAAKNTNIKTIDITGGAPEMNPNLKWFIAEIYKLNKEILVRTNLSILQDSKYHDFIQYYKQYNVVLIASLPGFTEENVDQQRGAGVFNMSIQSLIELNKKGYGMDDSGLFLHLVYNPGDPSLPAPQTFLEEDYKRELWERFKIKFNKLYTITNIPIGRYKKYLEKANKLEDYYKLLSENFNPCAADKIMCRNTISVDWQGFLYDCDFNQMVDLKIGSENPISINNFSFDSLKNRKIIVRNHCYGCTAGSGSSCQGSIV